jgi:hypothetical protein
MEYKYPFASQRCLTLLVVVLTFFYAGLLEHESQNSGSPTLSHSPVPSKTHLHLHLSTGSLAAEEASGLRSMGEFDDYWARAYRGDSGVPHSDPQRLVSTWTGAFTLGAAACVHHHASALASHLKSLPQRCLRRLLTGYPLDSSPSDSYVLQLLTPLIYPVGYS